MVFSLGRMALTLVEVLLRLASALSHPMTRERRTWMAGLLPNVAQMPILENGLLLRTFRS
jgi:hypothetical protein